MLFLAIFDTILPWEKKMEQTPRISVIVTHLEAKKSVFSSVKNIKRALAYVSYRLNKPLQFEIVYMVSHVAAIQTEEAEQLKKIGPISIYIEPDDLLAFQEGANLAKYPVRVMLDGKIEIEAESLGKAIIGTINEYDMVIATSLPSGLLAKKDSPWHDLTPNILYEIQKVQDAKAFIFRKEVWDSLKKIQFTKSRFKVDLLTYALEAGFKARGYEYKRHGTSISSRWENVKDMVEEWWFYGKLGLRKKIPLHTSPVEDTSMIGAGVRYKKKHFTTHSTLSYKDSAIDSFTAKQKFFIASLLSVVVVGLFANVIMTMQIVIAILSFFYLMDVFFNLFLVSKTVRGSSEITFTDEELQKIADESLPVYTILCPMYKEAHMLGYFLDGIAKIDWPTEKLDVIVLLEEDDKESIKTIGAMQLPLHVRTLVVPASQPQTKPKACNYGLAFAKGEYIVIFDAEDIPDPLQLKKAYLGFKKSDRKIVCLQAKLNYHNTNQNLLTRFFTAEYSWLFDISLPGLQSLNTIIPLGGTSNHFRKEDLIMLHGWDPFNVTEDADLGVRIFRLGYRTGIIDSVTLEEANSNVINWIRQRSRWVKGYMQTYLVHTRELLPMIRARGLQALMLHFVIGGRILFIFVNPLLWIVTISYFMSKALVGPVIEQVYSPAILYIGVISLVFGNYLYILGYVLGCVKRNQWGLIKYVFLSPFYLLLISIAGCMAFYQLLFKPYYWEKTVHGLHLQNKPKQKGLAIEFPKFGLPKLSRKSYPLGNSVVNT